MGWIFFAAVVVLTVAAARRRRKRRQRPKLFVVELNADARLLRQLGKSNRENA